MHTLHTHVEIIMMQHVEGMKSTLKASERAVVKVAQLEVGQSGKAVGELSR